VAGLVGAGHRVTLVSFGKLPLPHQTTWIKGLRRLDYRPTEYRLEWMETAERDIEESRLYLKLVIAEVKPDVLHLSQYSYGDLEVDLPKIVVAHSDIVSWWVRVHGREPEDTPWIRNYRETVARGLRGAELVIAPSAWMLDQLAKYYGPPQRGLVIYNGRSPHLFESCREKEDFVLSVGRLWDPAQNLALWFEHDGEARVSVVGWEREPGGQGQMRNLRVPANVTVSGAKSQDELRELYARASIYAATSSYEPFGLAPLEAALSRCALVLNDNPVFHELWDGRGIFFDQNDSRDLARQVDALRRDSALRREYADLGYEAARVQFTAARMVEQYEQAYEEVSSAAKVG
jgi:glycosyltransferase involved in cell wall biosynthesis